MTIHALNRLLILSMSVLTVVFFGGLVFRVWAYPRSLGISLRQMGGALISADPAFQTLVSVVGLAVALIAFLLLLGQFLPDGGPVVHLAGLNGGSAVISIEALIAIVKQEAESVPSVISARPHITTAGGQVDVLVELSASVDAHMPSTIDEMCRLVRLAVEGRVGVSIRTLSVQVNRQAIATPPALAHLRENIFQIPEESARVTSVAPPQPGAGSGASHPPAPGE